jgi:uncharacterized NAD-dependent epimerase/dehydratase family protein
MSKTNAIVYCEGAFNTPNGKTAHGLVRFTRRYHVVAVVDSRYQGRDAGDVLDGCAAGIPVVGSVEEAVRVGRSQGKPPERMIVGLAPDGGRLGPDGRRDVAAAIEIGLGVDSGLHDYLTEDPHFIALARKNGVTLRDVRKPPPISELHFFSGAIERVLALKIAVLGTDSAVGKRTTAWKIVDGLVERGHGCELVGTGQTAWLQGATYSLLLDSLINDFLTGEIEHAVVSAWDEKRPDAIVIEGQGGLLNPGYPGGYEIIAAARPDVIVLQHAPARREYDGFPGYAIHPLARQIEALEIISGKRVVAVAVNHENIPREQIPVVCAAITQLTGLPAADVLVEGAGRLIDELEKHLALKRGTTLPKEMKGKEKRS